MKHLKVTCTGCSHDNHLPIDQHTRCSKCSKRLFTWKRRFRNIVSEAIVVTLIFTGGKYYANNYSTHRYSVAQEYSILDTCVNSYNNVISRSNYKLKRKLCICAMESCQEEADISELRNKPHLFRTKLLECKRATYSNYRLPVSF